MRKRSTVSRNPNPRLSCPVLLLILTLLTGCRSVGPRTIPAARFDYNHRIARSQNDQLLLNLVRLRYRDTPVFLEVGTVIAQYTVSARAGVSPTINVDGSPVTEFGLDVGGSYSEQPTITYEPLKGAEFAQRLLAPISPVTLILLSQSGWSIERLLLCCVESINNVTNAPSASGPTPSSIPDNEEFKELAHLLRELQIMGALDFQPSFDEERRTTIVRLERPSDSRPASVTLRRARELLGLSDDQDRFELIAPGHRRSPGEIVLAGRSLLGVLFFLSHAVEAPADHERRGLVTVGDSGGESLDWGAVTGDLLKVASAGSPPSNAFVRIPYRGHWFYIEDSDLHSKATFSLLTYLFSLQSAGGQGANPLLTVPVGR